MPEIIAWLIKKGLQDWSQIAFTTDVRSASPPLAAEPTMKVRRESFAALLRIVFFMAGLPKFSTCR